MFLQCYTTQGLELVRVTVVNSSLQVVFDTFVKPDNDVIDYNTRWDVAVNLNGQLRLT